MKLHFDSKQEYQINSIESVIKLFEGQMKDANIEFRTV